MKSSKEILLEDIKNVVKKIDCAPLRKKRILLTGARGLLGSYFAHLMHYLNSELSYGIEADLITKNPIAASSFLQSIVGTPGLSFFAKDVSEPIAYDRAYDYMIHAAGYGTPAVFVRDPIKTIDVNYIGIQSMLKSARRRNPSTKILYCSSSKIYGSPSAEHVPTPETFVGESSVTSNRACYIESKRLSEVLCLAYASEFGMDVKIARPALTYGPALTFLSGRVISEFMKKAYLYKKIEMKDDGRDLRAYCYGGDTLRQLLSILLYSKDRIYNVGSSEEEVSIKELAERIGVCMGASVLPGPGKDEAVTAAPSRVCLDMAKVINEFGFKPEVSLDKGLGRMIDWNMALIKEGILRP